MTKTTNILACGAVLLPLVLATGCATSDAESSSDKPPTASSTKLDSAFLARAEKVCRPYMRYNSTHYFTVTGFNRFAPSAGLLDRVAAYLDRNPSYRTLGAELESLGQPDSGRAVWGAVMDDLATSQRLMRNEIRSAHQGDVAAYKTYDERLTENTAGLHSDLVKLGLAGGSACYGVQGDPLATAPRAE
jgi:hypothetical protein